MKCTYCDAPAILPQIIHPPLCQRHHELVILRLRCSRFNLPVTSHNVIKLLKQINGRVALTPKEVPGLLRAMEAHDAHH